MHNKTFSKLDAMLNHREPLRPTPYNYLDLTRFTVNVCNVKFPKITVNGEYSDIDIERFNCIFLALVNYDIIRI